ERAGNYRSATPRRFLNHTATEPTRPPGSERRSGAVEHLPRPRPPVPRRGRVRTSPEPRSGAGAGPGSGRWTDGGHRYRAGPAPPESGQRDPQRHTDGYVHQSPNEQAPPEPRAGDTGADPGAGVPSYVPEHR